MKIFYKEGNRGFYSCLVEIGYFLCPKEMVFFLIDAGDGIFHNGWRGWGIL